MRSICSTLPQQCLLTHRVSFLRCSFIVCRTRNILQDITSHERRTREKEPSLRFPVINLRRNTDWNCGHQGRCQNVHGSSDTVSLGCGTFLPGSPAPGHGNCHLWAHLPGCKVADERARLVSFIYSLYNPRQTIGNFAGKVHAEKHLQALGG